MPAFLSVPITGSGVSLGQTGSSCPCWLKPAMPGVSPYLNGFAPGSRWKGNQLAEFEK